MAIWAEYIRIIRSGARATDARSTPPTITLQDWSVCPEWPIVASDGYVAIARHDPAAVVRERRLFSTLPPIALGRLHEIDWRSYATVRPLVGRSGAVAWGFLPGVPGRLTWRASTPDVGEASCWVPWPARELEASCEILLQDRYLWPARGADWMLAYWPGRKETDPPTVALQRGGDLIVIKGMRA